MRQTLIHSDKSKETISKTPLYDSELKRRAEELKKYKGEA